MSEEGLHTFFEYRALSKARESEKGMICKCFRGKADRLLCIADHTDGCDSRAQNSGGDPG